MDIKNMLQKHKIVTLDMEIYNKESKNFGQVIFDFIRDGQKYQLILQTHSYKDTCEMLMRLWFDIISFTHHETPISEQETLKIIEEIKNKIIEEKKKEKEIEIQTKKEEEKKFSDNKREKVVATIDQTINDIQDFKEKIVNIVSGNDLKHLTNYQEELKKVRRGTNVDKMLQLLEETLLLVNKLQNQYFTAIKMQEKPIRDWSIVTDVDVMQEYEKYERAKKVMQAWATKNKDDNYYIMFGKVGMYLRFLKKDIIEKSSKFVNVFTMLLDLAEYTIIFLVINFGLYFFFKKLWWWQDIVDNIYKQLFYLWVAWLSLLMSKFIKARTSLMMVFQLWIAILIYFLVSWFLVNIFSL